jgi:hypothetical protein
LGGPPGGGAPFGGAPFSSPLSACASTIGGLAAIPSAREGVAIPAICHAVKALVASSAI